MIKRIIFIKRKDGMSREAFKEYWLNKHAPVVRTFPEVKKYVVNYITQSLSPEGVPYDGIAELWFEDKESMDRLFNSDRFKEFAKNDNPNFQDVPARRLVAIEEHSVI